MPRLSHARAPATTSSAEPEHDVARGAAVGPCRQRLQPQRIDRRAVPLGVGEPELDGAPGVRPGEAVVPWCRRPLEQCHALSLPGRRPGPGGPERGRLERSIADAGRKLLHCLRGGRRGAHDDGGCRPAGGRVPVAGVARHARQPARQRRAPHACARRGRRARLLAQRHGARPGQPAVGDARRAAQRPPQPVLRRDLRRAGGRRRVDGLPAAARRRERSPADRAGGDARLPRVPPRRHRAGQPAAAVGGDRRSGRVRPGRRHRAERARRRCRQRDDRRAGRRAPRRRPPRRARPPAHRAHRRRPRRRRRPAPAGLSAGDGAGRSRPPHRGARRRLHRAGRRRGRRGDRRPVTAADGAVRRQRPRRRRRHRRHRAARVRRARRRLRRRLRQHVLRPPGARVADDGRSATRGDGPHRHQAAGGSHGRRPPLVRARADHADAGASRHRPTPPLASPDGGFRPRVTVRQPWRRSPPDRQIASMRRGRVSTTIGVDASPVHHPAGARAPPSTAARRRRLAMPRSRRGVRLIRVVRSADRRGRVSRLRGRQGLAGRRDGARLPGDGVDPTWPGALRVGSRRHLRRRHGS